ncbi:MAG: RNA ligase family protein [Gammaproteobacteria bacterium]|nr:RNA ligase family protein [Gammaproteobacteria bacterium]MCY4219472.1 RNA ligase family protein [Gammaproteobacteria bacterium]MCY4276038.1 RNA ligase family protein [Gammaproteobacteria bacterium]
MNRKYPKTPYWPFSPYLGRNGRIHADPSRFVDVPVVISEKLDGSSILIHESNVYGRSVSAPSDGKWMAMVKKHHAWKVTEPHIYLYGEDIYGKHSIEYDAVQENRTFYAFALRVGTGAFCSFTEMSDYAIRKNIPVIPVLFDGVFGSVAEVYTFIDRAHEEPSVLGGEREGIVMRLSCDFAESEFSLNICKSVRVGHVKNAEHWTKNWKPCKVLACV